MLSLGWDIEEGNVLDRQRHLKLKLARLESWRMLPLS
jgi:hypothetical protein